MVEASAAHPLWGLDASIFICNQSVRELAAAVEANNIRTGNGCGCHAAALFAVHRGREAAPSVPTTEDQIERIYKLSSIEATRQALGRDTCHLEATQPMRVATFLKLGRIVRHGT